MKHSSPSDQGPPVWARRFFRWYCRAAFVEDLEGDLDEMYDERLRQVGRRQANRLFVQDVFLLFRPTIVRRLTLYPFLQNQPAAMYRNYFKTGLRHLLKYKSYALLNISGLAIGMAAAIVLFLIVRYERSFDTFHPEHERIYRLSERVSQAGEVSEHDLTPVPVVPTLLEEIPEVMAGTRFFAPNAMRLRYQDRSVNPLVHFVDAGFADVFDFDVVAGDLRQTLVSTNQVVLTQTVAEQLFGAEGAVGQAVEVVNDERRLTVGAVLADPPAYSSLQFEVLLPWANAPEWVTADFGWYDTFMTGYVKLTPHASATALFGKLQSFRERHYTGEKAARTQLHLRPLAAWRTTDADNQSMINLLSLMALITLMIAGVNFTNLSVAQSLLRVREIGVRKALGSLRSQLVGQFLAESLLTTGVALVFATALVSLILPSVNHYFDLSLTFRYWHNVSLFGVLLLIGLAIGVAAGMYPALFVSRLSPIASLQGLSERRLSGRWMQHGLIVAQYTASILLIAGTLVIWRQTQFMKSQDLRFDQENVVGFSLWYDRYDFDSQEQAKSAIKTMIDRLEDESSIASLTFAENMPGRYNSSYNSFYDSDAPHQHPVNLRQVMVGNDYFKTLGIDLVTGKLPVPELAPDSGFAVVINEAAQRALGWQSIDDKYLVPNGEGVPLPVIGVVEDYHYQSLQKRIEPMVHSYYPGDEYYYGHIAARLQPGRTADGLSSLEAAYQSLNPLEPFDYYFLEEDFDKMYRAQERLGLTATLFASIAVILASLGLLALTAFATRQRQQEVGIRKVLGASVTQVMALLSKNFAVLIIMALVIAGPLIYYAAERFLQDFAYRIDLGLDTFFIAGAIALLVAAVSVGTQAFRAASANPTDALRDE